MRTVLVPVDFSETSLNAATYAVKMLTGVYGVNMILYHVYEKPEHAAASDKEMNLLKERLSDMGIVKMQILCEAGHDFGHCIERLARENPTDMIIMGITGKNKIAQIFIGSNTLKLIKKNICPVLIVPPGARFTQLKNIALTSDFTGAPSVAATAIIKNILSSYYAKLHIVNVNPEYHISITEPYQVVKDVMEEAFNGYQHDFHFIDLYDFHDTINLFVNDHSIDMTVTLPKDHNWLNSLTSGSHTKRMAHESTIPVLAIHY
ncbi:MAG: universal stress protein [Bacteroidota bacterium]